MDQKSGKIELTKAEIHNGWTVESLGKYLEEREKAAQMKIFRPPRKPFKQNSGYNPFKWR